jgi:hypothetical protein
LKFPLKTFILPFGMERKRACQGSFPLFWLLEVYFELKVGKRTIFGKGKRMRALSHTVCLIAALTLLAGAANADLIAHWTFDEGQGGTATDSAGSNNGTIHQAAWMQGKIGGALTFDGQDDYVLGSTSPFDFANATFSVCAWFKTTDLDTVTIVSEGSYGNGGWMLGINGYVYFALKSPNYTDNACSTLTTESYNDGQWHHAAAVISTNTSNNSGNSAVIYIDGNPVNAMEGTKNSAYGYKSSTTNWSIGARDGATRNFFNGSIDDVRIYNHALSGQEIASLVPEPATMTLLGLGGLLLWKRIR